MAVAGCGTAPSVPPPLTSDASAAALEARSFNDPGLQRFLREEAGRVVPPWDFEALAWVAFYYHPSLELARAEWASARAAIATAAARPNPSLTLTPGYSTNPPAGVSPWFPALGLDFLFETAGKRDRRTAAATYSAEAARLAVFSNAWEVRTELRRALLELSAATARLPVLEAQRAAQQRIATLLDQRRAAGAASSLELATARTALMRSESALAATEADRGRARSRVAQALAVSRAAIDALPLDQVIPRQSASRSLDPVALAAARAEALRTRADVLAALASYEAARATLEGELRRRYPDVRLGPGYQWDQGENKWSIGLALELPVFHRNEGPIAEAAAKCRERAAQLTAVQAQIIGTIDEAAAALPLAAAQVRRAAQLRDEARRQGDRVQLRFDQGAADRLELETAHLERDTAELALLDAQAALASAEAQLDAALRIPFDRVERLTVAAGPAAPLTPP